MNEVTSQGPLSGRLLRFLDRHSPLAVLVVPLVLVSVLIGSYSADLNSTVTAGLINIIIVVGLYVFVGNSGIISFGQIAFAALGGYLSAILTMSALSKDMLLPDLGDPLAALELPTPAATLVVAAVAAVIAYVVAIPLMRLTGIAAGIATLALLVIAQIIIRNWSAVSGGGGGTLTGIPVDAGLETVLTWTAAACAVAWLYQRSSSGLRLRASREDELAARSLGVRVERERRRAFALSAAIVAVAGSLYGHSVGSVTPDAFYLSLTFLTLAMLVVGGINSLSGALAGALVITVLTEVFGRLESGTLVGGLQLGLMPGLREMTIAVLTITILMFRPQGLTGSREPSPLSAWFFRRRSTESQPDGAGPAGSADDASQTTRSDAKEVHGVASHSFE